MTLCGGGVTISIGTYIQTSFRLRALRASGSSRRQCDLEKGSTYLGNKVFAAGVLIRNHLLSSILVYFRHDIWP
jgi:hypothetical protein